MVSLTEIPVVVLVFAASWLAAPLIYTLDKLAAMEDSRWVFAAGVITLPLFGLICTILAKDSPGKKEPLFYGKLFTDLRESVKWFYRCSLLPLINLLERCFCEPLDIKMTPACKLRRCFDLN